MTNDAEETSASTPHTRRVRQRREQIARLLTSDASPAADARRGAAQRLPLLCNVDTYDEVGWLVGRQDLKRSSTRRQEIFVQKARRRRENFNPATRRIRSGGARESEGGGSGPSARRLEQADTHEAEKPCAARTTKQSAARRAQTRRRHMSGGRQKITSPRREWYECRTVTRHRPLLDHYSTVT